MVEGHHDGGIDPAVSAPLDRAWRGRDLARATTALVPADPAGAPLCSSARHPLDTVADLRLAEVSATLEVAMVAR